MTIDAPRVVTNVIVASAGAAAAYVILTTPPLRRLAWRLSQVWLSDQLAVVARDVRGAWMSA